MLRISGGFSRLALGLLYGALLFILGYPLGGYLGVEPSMFLPFLLIICLLVRSPLHIFVGAFAVLVNTIAQREVLANSGILMAPALHENLSFAFYSSVLLFTFAWLRKQLDLNYELFADSKRLENAVRQLTAANVNFQEYAATIRERSYKAERDRITRDLHDSIGYSLTNLIMMLEAAKDLPEKAPNEVVPALERAKSYSEITLHDVRLALRAIRSIQDQSPNHLQALNRLITIFREATGVDVQIEFGNVDLSILPPDTFGILYRVVQESLTNAFRHGRARAIWVYLWQVGDRLHFYVRDNGLGSASQTDGIGLQGMRERVRSVGGELRAGNAAIGFEVQAELPLR
jgi:signal transduction histidine kinase